MKKSDRLFQVFLKPAGSACNLKCGYCYYPDTVSGSGNRSTNLMPESILEKYIKDHFEAAPGNEFFFSWHGGEPTLAGLDFYRRAVELQKKLKPAGSTVVNGIQTNGTLLDDEWCRFFADENFYVGISIDGPGAMHNKSRVTSSGAGSFRKAVEGYERIKRHGIRNEILCVVSSVNVEYPLEVYRFLKSLGTGFMTFLPLVNKPGTGIDPVNNYTVDPDEFGNFLCAIFDEWLSEDIGKIKIQIIEESIGTVFRRDHTLCIFKKVCGGVPVVEKNGDFYSCDHFVSHDYYVGNITQSTLAKLLDSEKQKKFGELKRDLPRYCHKCEVLEFCNGECPKNRFILTPDGEPGLNYLCSGYRKFFNHIRPFTEAVAAEWKRNNS